MCSTRTSALSMADTDTPTSWDVLRQQLRHLLVGKLESALNKKPLDLDYLDFLSCHVLTLLEAFSEQIEEITDEIAAALQNLHYFVVNDLDTIPDEPKPGPGAPRIISETERLQHMLDTNLPISCIAKILYLSRTAICRRKRELELSVRGAYSTMSDRELDNLILAFKNQMPDAGYRLVICHVVSMGLHVQNQRLMASMHRVDAAGIFSQLTELGWNMQSTSGRGPLALLNVDTNHQLNRYNIVIFGGVDGYSRKILYLDAATNNEASTAFSFFFKSTQRYGIPSRVCGSQGLENMDIADFMFATKGTSSGSFIAGKSLRNQRMKRLWRDVWIAVLSKYYNILHSLEKDCVLDISDDIHLFGVHYIFVTKLQKDLKTFIGGWNRHPLKTDAGLTPQQLWFLGQNQDRDEGEQLQGLENPDIDWESVVLGEDLHVSVKVPEFECPLDEESLEDLRRTIDPLEHSQFHGRDLYVRYLHWVSNRSSGI